MKQESRTTVDWGIDLIFDHFWLLSAVTMMYFGWLAAQYVKRFLRSSMGHEPNAGVLHLCGSGFTFILAHYCLQQQWAQAPEDQLVFGAFILALGQAVAVEGLFRYSRAKRPNLASALSGNLYVDEEDRTIMHTVVAAAAGASVSKSRRKQSSESQGYVGTDRRGA
jgi:hypothetical protein